MPFIEREGTRLYYSDEGSGEQALVFIHGWTCDGNDWSHQVPAMTANGYRVVTVDIRGHGRSGEAADGDYSLEAFAGDVAAIAEACGIERAVLVGHSLGFAIAVHAWKARAELVRALVDVDGACAAGEGARDWLQGVAAGLNSGAHDVATAYFAQGFYTAGTPVHLQWSNNRRLRAMPEPIIARTFQGFAQGPEAFLFRKVSEPVLRGIGVPILSFRMHRNSGRWMESILSAVHSKVVVWEGSGHFLHIERPAEFNALLIDWLGELPAAE